MAYKISSVMTYLGLLQVGDYIKLSFVPGCCNANNDTHKVFAIWKWEGETIGLGFNEAGVKSDGACYAGGSDGILGSKTLLKIVPHKVTNWRKKIE